MVGIGRVWREGPLCGRYRKGCRERALCVVGIGRIVERGPFMW